MIPTEGKGGYVLGKDLVEALADFNEDSVMEEVKNRLDSDEDPMDIVHDLQKGMELVGDRYNKGTYFLSELIMAADLFTRAMALIEPSLEGTVQEKLGKMVIGTPKGDIHDIGKNIFSNVAKGAGFEVHDLGVDVPVERFLEVVEEVKPGLGHIVKQQFIQVGTEIDLVQGIDGLAYRLGVRVVLRRIHMPAGQNRAVEEDKWFDLDTRLLARFLDDGALCAVQGRWRLSSRAPAHVLGAVRLARGTGEGLGPPRRGRRGAEAVGR